MRQHEESAARTTAWVRFDRWAGAVLIVFAIIAVVVAILVSSATPEAIRVAVILAAGFLAAGIHLVAAYGLSTGRPWSRPVAILLLWLAVVVGIAQFALALAGSSLMFPLGAIAAALVLRMRPTERTPWPDRHWRSVVAVLIVFMVSLLLPPVANWVM